jgi:hypothetical protein
MDITEWKKLKEKKSRPVALILNKNRYPESCGYRNIQMIWSSFDRGDISIQEIQISIEMGWKEQGWDPQGAIHFDYQLKNKICWIGATEVVVFFHSMGIGCSLFDFHKSTLGKHILVFEFCLRYFNVSNQYPLYLQHQGHSRTIVGIQSHPEQLKSKLILFDPELGVRYITLDQLIHKQYQIVQVGVELPKSKILTSTRIP